MSDDNFITKLKKKKVPIIVATVIWLFGEIFLIAPIAYSLQASTINGSFNFEIFLEQVITTIASLNGFIKVLEIGAIGKFFFSTIIFTIFYSICVGIGMWKSRKRGEYDSIEHGSSDWSQAGEQYRVLSKNSGLILAEDNYLPLNKLGNINVLIVGGSGSGKSASYSIPNAHLGLGSYIFTDPKGEIYDATAGYLREQGYDIKLLNLVNPESSDSYNPIFHVQSQLDVDIIASTIVKGQKAEGSTADPYWDNMSELLLKALIYYLLATRPPEEQNLASCAELVRAANNNGDSNLLSDLINKLPYDHPARMNFKSVELASEKTYSSILSSLQSSLGKFDSKEIADVTSTNTIDFEDLVTKKTALYVVSSDTHTAYDFLLTIFFSQMIQQLYDFADKNGGRLPVPAFFILDEFANIGQIPDFDKKISTSRSRGISFSVILQNLDQLKGIYEKSYETIIGNCDTHVFLGSNSYETVEYFSKELGEKTISHYSKSTNRDNHAVRQGFSESDQIMARALMTPDELRRMDNNDCIIFEKGLKPIKAKKYWWFKKNNVVKDLNNARISHNDYKVQNRGEWRKFNPYNPYQEPKEDTSKELDITPLDDLFSEIDTTSNDINNTQNKQVYNNNENNTQIQGNNGGMHQQKQNNKSRITPINHMEQRQNNNIKTGQQTNPVNNVQPINTINNIHNNTNNSNSVQNNNPNNNTETQRTIPQPIENHIDEIDIEKELEAKFDELFGTLGG
ncbi:MAG: type IV secretory system conjugative DNA transfer family protein [Clostridia bacterium]|nr:type IV secretory system conjugative DNA transfer family protein [Clostridia bacterium]